MKACTDLEQSKKLAEILSLESADMCFNISQCSNMPPLMNPYSKFNEFFNIGETPDFLIPCWSLAALLSVMHSVIPDVSLNSYNNGDWNAMVLHGKMIYVDKDNPVDACVELIITLHGLKLI